MITDEILNKIKNEQIINYFGNKHKVSGMVWKRLVKVDCYIEPFFGTGAVLFANPYWQDTLEVVSDLNGFITNLWRSIKYAPEEVCKYADNSINHIDFHARRKYVLEHIDETLARLRDDPEYYDAKLAGYWLYVNNCTIGGAIVKIFTPRKNENVMVRLPEICATKYIFKKKLAEYDFNEGECFAFNKGLRDLFKWFSIRLRNVRLLCCDYAKILNCINVLCKAHPRKNARIFGIFLDPPYSEGRKYKNLYFDDDPSLAKSAREWCKRNGDNKAYRIALCGYEEHEELVNDYGWSKVKWKASRGYGNFSRTDKDGSRHKETIYFSPHCLNTESDTHDTLFNFNS